MGLGTCSAQTAGIFGSTNLSLNTTGVHADPSSIFDIAATGKGLLIPRMTTGNRPSSPVTSLLIFNTTTNQYEYYDGSAWVQLVNTGMTGAWSINGNSGTVDGTNFIGTTDDKPFNIRVNNQKAGRIESYSWVGNNFANTYFGYQAGNGNATGNNNTAIGTLALYSNTDGSSNTATGSSALYSNTTGNGNTASGGAGTLYNNTEGSDNTATGNLALYINTTGNSNTATGVYALYTNTTGNNNTANGVNSLYFNAASNNTALGYQAGYTATPANATTTGSNNTFLGYNTGFASATQRTNATAIGYNALVDASNAMVLGGTGADAVNVGISTTAPTAKLHVAGNARINDGADRNIRFASDAGQNNIGGVTLYSANDIDNLYKPLSINGSPTVINGSGGTGNVGIGNSSPASLFSVGASNQFQVNSSGNIVKLNNVTTSFPAANASGVLNNDGTGTLTWGALPSGANAWTKSGANIYQTTLTDLVGIGTSTPASNLQVLGSAGPNNTGITANGNIHLTDGTQNNIWADANLSLMTGGFSERIRILSTGNVGIATTAPTAFLHINPTITATADVKNFQSGIVYNGATPMTNWYGSYIAAPTGTGTITNKYALVTEAGAGNVGIGTSDFSDNLGGLINFFTAGGMRFNQYLRTGNSQIVLWPTYDNSRWIFDAPSSSLFFNSAGGSAVVNFGTSNALSPLALYSGNAERVRVDVNGNVGIGTTSPAARLHTVGAVNTSGNPGTWTPTAVFDNAATSSQLPIELRVAGTTRGYLRVDNTGNIVVSGSGSGSTYLNWDGGATGNGTIFGNGAQAEVARITNGGNVGIGSTSPGAKLDVAGNIRAGSATPNAMMGTHPTYGNGYAGWWKDGADYSMLTDGTNSWFNAPAAAGNIYFRTANADKMFIQGSTGNVGIGTTSPNAKLDVVGTVRLNDNAIYLRTTADPNHGLVYDAAPDGPRLFGFSAVVFGTTNGGYSEKMRVTSGGNVGIGTTAPTAKLHVNTGSIGAISQFSGGTGYLSIENPSGSIYDIKNYASGGYLRFFVTGFAGAAAAACATPGGSTAFLWRTDLNDLMLLTSNGQLNLRQNLACGLSFDLAENFPNYTDTELEPGDVLCVSSRGNQISIPVAECSCGNPSCKEHLKSLKNVIVLPEAVLERSSAPYQTTLVGVYSTKPGMLLGNDIDNPDAPTVPLTLAGRVPVKVSAEGGSIKVGDLLTTSSTPGYAMKANEPWYGGIIGTALQSFDGKTGTFGKITVLVHLNPAPTSNPKQFEMMQEEIDNYKNENMTLKERIKRIEEILELKSKK